MQTPVQSLEQLSRQSRIAYTVVEGSDTHQYFKNMKHAEDKLYELWKQTTLNASTDESLYRYVMCFQRHNKMLQKCHGMEISILFLV